MMSSQNYWEWWNFIDAPLVYNWYVRINLDTNHWLVVYCGKIVVSEIF